MELSEFSRSGAVAIAQAIRDRRLTARDAVTLAKEATERVNPELNSLTFQYWDTALETAEDIDPALPFAGVPTVIKETAAEAGKPWTFGSRAFAGNIAPQTDGYVARLTALGFNLIGRSNSPELGLLDVTEPLLFGPTRNPWNPAHTAGGSSGGAAAAVAAGIVPFAHGNDGGGSLRAPASHTGLFSMKPTRRRLNVPYLAAGAPDWLPELVGTLGLSAHVEDIAHLLELIEPDPASATRFDCIHHCPACKGLKVAVIGTGLTGDAPHKDVSKTLDVAAILLTDMGHHVELVVWPFDAAAFHAAFFEMWKMRTLATVSEAEAMLGRSLTEDDLEPFTLGLAHAARQLAPEAVAQVAGVLQDTASEMAKFLDRYDVLLTPVAATPPVAVGHHAPSLPFDTLFTRASRNVAFTPLANACGFPAMSVPMGLSEDELPIGVMFSAAAGRDGLLIQLAYALEEAAPWTDRLPPVHASR